jgi:hypothetical protein
MDSEINVCKNSRCFELTLVFVGGKVIDFIHNKMGPY